MNTTHHDGVAFDKQKKKEKKDNDRELAVLPETAQSFQAEPNTFD